MELKLGYKQTDVGVIPEEWEVRSSAEICLKIQDGTHFSPSIRGDDYLYVTSKNIGFGVFDVSSADRIDTPQHKAIYDRCDVRKGDLLLTKDGANTGNAALNNLDEEFSLLSSVAFLRFDSNKHVPSYYLQQILSASGQRRIKDLMAGNAITRLTLDKIRKLRFPVPPLPEQRAIAAALSDVDEFIRALNQLIAKKRDIKQAAMQQLLTGKQRLPGFDHSRGKRKQTEIGVIPEDWECTRVSGIAAHVRNAIVGGPFGSDLVSTDYVGHGVPVIRGQNMGERYLSGQFVFVTPAKAKSLESNLARPGDIVFTQRGTLGQVSLVPETPFSRYLVSQSQMKLTVNAKSAAPIFFYYVFSSREKQEYIRQSAIQTGVPHINLSILRSIPVQLPPIAEQHAIANILSDMDAEVAALEQKRDKTRAIKQGMMQELLTGKTRLIEVPQATLMPA